MCASVVWANTMSATPAAPASTSRLKSKHRFIEIIVYHYAVHKVRTIHNVYKWLKTKTKIKNYPYVRFETDLATDDVRIVSLTYRRKTVQTSSRGR